MHTSWEDAETFLAVAESRSFSAAAHLLGVGQPTVSRRIAGLEGRLGCQLFTRGKQGAELTDWGAKLLPAAEQMARWAAEFGRLAQGAEETPAGIVRIAAPPGLAVEVLAPLAARVRDRLPEIRLEILASIEYVDLSRGGADLAVRTRESHEPELTTLHRAAFEIGVFATAGYRTRLDERLAAEGRGAESTRLEDLDWITWSFPYESVAPRPMLERAIPDFAPAFASDNYLVLRSALDAGLGVMVLEKQGIPVAAPSPEARLVEIDLGFSLPPSEYHLVCARSMRYVPRVRAIADLLVERLEEGRAS
ncbi:MAG TPA: LysR family transcriptional regulator [Deltaproteobacteria bacterium]|nr:LysR family transcriptional regulator [Deltaproteobacteria bacterium]